MTGNKLITVLLESLHATVGWESSAWIVPAEGRWFHIDTHRPDGTGGKPWASSAKNPECLSLEFPEFPPPALTERELQWVLLSNFLGGTSPDHPGGVRVKPVPSPLLTPLLISCSFPSLALAPSSRGADVGSS